MYNKQREPFVALEVYLKPTGKTPPKFEYQASSKTMFKDTLTNKKYTTYQFANWLNEKHVVEKVKQGYLLKLGSVDIESDRMDKYTHSNMQRKFIWYFVKDSFQARNVDGMKPIAQAMPQYRAVAMTQAQPSAPDNAMPITMQDHKQLNEDSEPLDDEIPF
tara:strand:+ start:464 stop:946 length:483 start_codon:yes stop_codon:yes gene_type:complete